MPEDIANGHIPLIDGGKLKLTGLWCKRCGYLLADREGNPLPRSAKPCIPARISLRQESIGE